MHRYRAEGLDFLKTAPRRYEFAAEVAAARPEVFAAISADPSTWTWFPRLSGGGYEGDSPHGLGSIREARMGRAVYRETMLAWDEPTRWAYRVDESSVPVGHALVEDWVLEERGDRTVVHWTFAIDPRPLFLAGLPLARRLMGRLFGKAMANLSARLSSGREHG